MGYQFKENQWGNTCDIKDFSLLPVVLYVISTLLEMGFFPDLSDLSFIFFEFTIKGNKS